MIDNYIHPDDYPELATQCVLVPIPIFQEYETVSIPKTEYDWEVILLVTLPLIGIGIMYVLGYLDVPIIEQVKNIPISIISNTSVH